MALVQRKTPEQKAQENALREQRRRDDEARRHAEALEKRRKAFFKTPAGKARLAFERGDHVFQYARDVMSEEAVVVAMVGSKTSRETTDPVDVVNSICREGWDLVNGSFVFIEQGQQSRDKLMSSGQKIATKGVTVGYYLFKRCEANRADAGDPWDYAPAVPEPFPPPSA
jgi:hypothetical protein